MISDELFLRNSLSCAHIFLDVRDERPRERWIQAAPLRVAARPRRTILDVKRHGVGKYTFSEGSGRPTFWNHSPRSWMLMTVDERLSCTLTAKRNKSKGIKVTLTRVTESFRTSTQSSLRVSNGRNNIHWIPKEPGYVLHSLNKVCD